MIKIGETVILQLLPIDWQFFATLGTLFLGWVALYQILSDRGVVKGYCHYVKSFLAGRLISLVFRFVITNTGRRRIEFNHAFAELKDGKSKMLNITALRTLQPGESVNLDYNATSQLEYENFSSCVITDSTGKSWKFPRKKFGKGPAADEWGGGAAPRTRR